MIDRKYNQLIWNRVYFFVKERKSPTNSIVILAVSSNNFVKNLRGMRAGCKMQIASTLDATWIKLHDCYLLVPLSSPSFSFENLGIFYSLKKYPISAPPQITITLHYWHRKLQHIYLYISSVGFIGTFFYTTTAWRRTSMKNRLKWGQMRIVGTLFCLLS